MYGDGNAGKCSVLIDAEYPACSWLMQYMCLPTPFAITSRIPGHLHPRIAGAAPAPASQDSSLASQRVRAITEAVWDVTRGM